MTKRSRLVRKILGPGFKWHLKPGFQKCPRDDHSKAGQSGFRMYTVIFFPRSSKRHVIDGKVEGIDYCSCNKKINSVYGAPTHDVAWTPFLERKVKFF